MIWDITYYVFVVVYIYTILTTILFLLVENRNPVKSIAWIFVLLFLPVLGFILYITFGKKFRTRHIISKRSLRLIQLQEDAVDCDVSNLPLTDSQRSLVSLGMGNSEAPFFENNSMNIFTDGNELYEKIFEDIKNAKQHIHLEYYIFCPDELGRRMMQALKAKAREGLKIRVIIDDVGSWKFKKRHIKELTDEGIEVESFLEVRAPFIGSRVNYRNHRKIIVIDGLIGYTGGINIADRYLKGLKWGTWRDTHVRIEGSAVLGLQKTFFEDWYFVKQSLIEDSEYYPQPNKIGNVMIQTVISGPDMKWESIMQIFAKSFAMATKRIFIETPYFLPPESISNALQSASLSGVDVKLILPYRSDAPITLYSSFSYLDQMFKAGVKVYFYQPGFIHSKVTIVDDNISMLGSANMDFRSLEQNFELNTIVYDEKITSQLVTIFEDDLQQSQLVDVQAWMKRSNGRRIKESLARLCSPLL